LLIRAGLLIVWLQLGVPGFRPVLARGWHGDASPYHLEACRSLRVAHAAQQPDSAYSSHRRSMRLLHLTAAPVCRSPGSTIASVSGNVLCRSCLRFFALSYYTWSTIVRWRPSPSAAIVTQLVTLLQARGRVSGLTGRFSHIRCAEPGAVALGAGFARSLIDVGCNALCERDGQRPFLYHFT